MIDLRQICLMSTVLFYTVSHLDKVENWKVQVIRKCCLNEAKTLTSSLMFLHLTGYCVHQSVLDEEQYVVESRTPIHTTVCQDILCNTITNQKACVCRYIIVKFKF